MISFAPAKFVFFPSFGVFITYSSPTHVGVYSAGDAEKHGGTRCLLA